MQVGSDSGNSQSPVQRRSLCGFGQVKVGQLGHLGATLARLRNPKVPTANSDSGYRQSHDGKNRCLQVRGDQAGSMRIQGAANQLFTSSCGTASISCQLHPSCISIHLTSSSSPRISIPPHLCFNSKRLRPGVWHSVSLPQSRSAQWGPPDPSPPKRNGLSTRPLSGAST